jgi:transcriptional regulator with XRE-family HTH domain
MRSALDLLRENVERERVTRGWSQAELARRIDMQPAQLSQVLKGESSPGLDTVERIAKGLGVTVSALLRAPAEVTDHGIRECHARVGRALDDWEKLARASLQAATGAPPRKKRGQ